MTAESHEFGSTRSDARRSSRLSRAQTLQVLLLVVVGLWSIESGMQSEPGDLAIRPPPLLDTDGASAVGDLPAVGSGAPARAGATPFAVGGYPDIELYSSPTVVRDSTPAALALGLVLGDVNPNLAPSEVDRIASAVLRYSAKYDLDPELVTAVLLVESTARPWVRSPKGAVGLMQVMPHMMEPLGLAGNAATIESNIEAGCWILANNIRRLGEEQGISSYFWGSDIRGSGYLRKVQAARDEVRRQLAS